MERSAWVPQNVAAWDRALRAVAAVILFAAAPLVMRQPYWLLAAGLASGLLLHTAISGY